MKITETLVVLFLVLFCYLFLDKFLFRGELGEICFGPMRRALARWHRRRALRKSLTYPPFCDICVIGFSAPLESKVIGASRWVTQLIKEYISQHRVNFPLRALGPAPCTFEMINNRYRYRLILKTRNTADFREMIKHVLGEFYKNKDYQTVRIYADINGDIGL